MGSPEVRTLLASAARTATTNSGDQPNIRGHRGVEVVINVSAAADTPSVVFTIQGRDPVSGEYYTILASAAVTGTGVTILRAFPGATAANNTVANFLLPAVWRVLATHADTDSITYSVSGTLLP
jgi:hypothetical protein